MTTDSLKASGEKENLKLFLSIMRKYLNFLNIPLKANVKNDLIKWEEKDKSITDTKSLNFTIDLA